MDREMEVAGRLLPLCDSETDSLGGEIDPVVGEIEVRPPTMEAAARHEEVVRGERSLR